MADSNENKQFRIWEEVILDFFENRVSESKLYKARDYIQKNETKLRKEKDSKKVERLKNSIKKKQEDLILLKQQAPKGEVYEWIKKTSQKKLVSGKKLIKGTHVLKFSHSSAPPEALCIEDKNDKKLILSTSSFKNLVYDIVHSNGNLITISRFFALSHKGKMIFDQVLLDDFSFLASFVSNDEKMKEIKFGLRNLVEEREIKTGEKTRQIYFPLKGEPINDDKDFHLLIPLFSSSLCEEVYSYRRKILFDEDYKEIRDLLKEATKNSTTQSSYRSQSYIDVPNLAVLKFGGAQPQNVSMLNKNRSWKASPKDRNSWGITYLFSSQPPTWQSELKPPRESLFDNLYNASIKTEIDYLRDFLLRFKKLELSIKDPKRKRHLERWVNNIINEFLFYVGSIQNLPAGWTDTEGIKLKPAHQYLLDPYRMDDAFQSARQSADWQKIIQTDFASWLNYHLRGKDKFTAKAEHTRLWKKILETPLREYMESIENEVKQQRKEAL